MRGPRGANKKSSTDISEQRAEGNSNNSNVDEGNSSHHNGGNSTPEKENNKNSHSSNKSESPIYNKDVESVVTEGGGNTHTGEDVITDGKDATVSIPAKDHPAVNIPIMR